MKLLVVSETHFVRDADGVVYAPLGVDGHACWQRYLGAFDEVLVAARTAEVAVAPTDLPRVEGPGVRVLPLPDYQGWWGALQAREAMRAALRDAVEQVDALCLRVPGLVGGLAWRVRGTRPFGVQVVGDPADAFAPGAVRSVARPFARAFLARDLRAMCAEASAASYVTERVLQARYPAGGWSTACSDAQLDDDAFVTPNSVRRRLADRLRVDSGTAAQPWRLLFVGSLQQFYKGPDVLIDAVARCRSRGLAVTLTIAGSGACRAALEARAAAAGAPVEFVGQVPAGAAVRALMDQSDLFVLPSRTEGLPRAMLEAMARGVPSLGSRVGGIPELLPPARLVPPGDVPALSDAINAMCGTPESLLGPALQDLEHARRFRSVVLRERWDAFLAQLASAAAPAQLAAGAAR